VVPLKNYCTGLLLPGGRKSVEPMAARLAPDNVRRWGWDTSKVAAGAAFTITPRCASRPMGSWWPSGTVFPPQRLAVLSHYQSRRSRPTSGPEVRRVRPERHNPYSIATLRMRIARHLLRQLPRCPFCGVLRL